MLGTKFVCCLALSLLFFIIPGGISLIIMLWLWYAYEVYQYYKLVQKHNEYIKWKREQNRKKGYTYID